MCFATGVEPTNERPRTSGWSSSASTATRSPWTTLKTPFGSFTSSIISATSDSDIGTCSEGLTTYVSPQATAYGQNQNGTMAGKLNGQTAAKTPSGVRMTSSSI